MSTSEEMSRSFYAELGASGLALRTRDDWDSKILAALIEMLPEGGRVLDLGCGYGRMAIPLARASYAVEGLDISPNLVHEARASADADGLSLGLVVGSMMHLPYSDRSFDAAISLWSAFHELLEETEQVRALSEMWRVLRPRGFAVVEGPLYAEPTDVEVETGGRRGPENRISWDLVEGKLNPHYSHDASSLERVCRSAGIDHLQVFQREWGGRPRMLLRIDKSP